jgi:hypothetical protein
VIAIRNHRYAIYPGSMGACAIAIDLFGIYRVSPSEWGGPVFADIGDDELEAAKALLAEEGLSLILER